MLLPYATLFRSTDYTYNTRVDGTKPTATKGTIADCYPDAASANLAALAATTGLSDNCAPSAATQAVQTGAGTCDTAIVIRVQDSCGNFTDYTYATRVDGTAPTATKGAIAACYPDAASANNAALAATTALTDNCGATGVTKTVQTGAGTCDTSIVRSEERRGGKESDYTYTTRDDGKKPTATQGAIAGSYPHATAANKAALAA